ncbi:MAG: hypothetical protein ACI97A_000887 [Planctomycetota bacterium]|jgi:hypothetical protein
MNRYVENLTMSYARARLWTGICGVGFMVVLSTIALSQNWALRFIPASSGFLMEMMTFLVIAMAYIVLVIPLDLVGGYLLPKKHGFSSMSLVKFLTRWHRGVVIQTTVFVMCATLILQMGQRLGVIGAISAYAGLMLLLLAIQAPLALIVGSMRMESGKKDTSPDDNVCVIESTDRAFMGGIVGLPGREKLLVPSHWQESIGKEGVLSQVKRRAAIVKRGWNSQGMAVACLWNLTGFSIACFMPNSSPAETASLVTLFLWLNLWTFLGLLLLPRISRRSTFAGDQEALKNGIPREILAKNIRHIDRLQEDEPERSENLESVFHPLPSVERRIRAFDEVKETNWAPWNVARIALFLSWAGMGMLARTVHCNAGKPEVWVLLPCD